MTTLNNGQISVSFDDNLGGVIDSLVDLATGIDFFGPRGSSAEPHAVLVSTWGDPAGADFGGWPLNMTQGNDQVFVSPAPIVSGPTLIAGEWYYKTQMVSFPYSDAPGNIGDWTVEQWLSISGKVLKVRSKVTYSGPDKSGGWADWPNENASGIGLNMWNQETPTRYLRDGNGLNRIIYYDGSTPWTGDTLTGPTIGPAALPGYGAALQPTEKWMHFCRPDGYGLAMYCPDVDYIGVMQIANDTEQPYAAGGIAHGFCNDVGYLKGPTLEFTTYYSTGTVEEIRGRFYDIHSPPPPIVFSAQPAIASLTAAGGVISYGTADIHAEDIMSAASSVVNVSDRQVIQETVTTLLSAGVTATSTKQMVETLVSAATVSTTISDRVQQVENLLAQISAYPTVADIYQAAGHLLAAFSFTQQPIITATAPNSATISYGTIDTMAEDATSTADVTTSIAEIITRVDSLLTTVQAIPSVADLIAQIETINSTATVETTVLDSQFQGAMESLQSVASALTSVDDVQRMTETVTALAQSSVNLTAVMTFLEQMAVAATGVASVSDTISGAMYLVATRQISGSIILTNDITGQVEPYTVIGGTVFAQDDITGNIICTVMISGSISEAG